MTGAETGAETGRPRTGVETGRPRTENWRQSAENSKMANCVSVAGARLSGRDNPAWLRDLGRTHTWAGILVQEELTMKDPENGTSEKGNWPD